MCAASAHPGGPVGDRSVDLADVAQVRVVGVLAPRGQDGALGGIVHAGQERVVELKVAAAQRGERANLVGVGGGQVGRELFEVGIDAAIDGGRPAAEKDHAGRRQSHLRHRGAQ